MAQMRLIPPPGSVQSPVPRDALDEARELLTEMLVVVLDTKKSEEDGSVHDGETDE